ncbi:MAG: ABC transporter permease subunit [Deltaproteobacteria bacterium]|nr:ABC transporter permease subunit [Deltaproteobacteria bacterium]
MAEQAKSTKSGVLRGGIGSPLANIWTIAKREFRAYFNGPMGYIVVTMFTLFVGLLFFFLFGTLVLRRATLQPLFTSMSALLPLLCAALSMRSFSEERQRGTIELLITLPVRDSDVVVGKFLGAMGVLFLTLLATITYPIALSRMGDLDSGPVIGGYIGILLGGGAYIAIGMVISSYMKDQISSFIVTSLLGYILYFMDKTLIFLPQSVSSVLEYLSTDFHFKSIARGVIDTRNLVYFGSVITGGLMIAARSLSSRRWS